MAGKISEISSGTECYKIRTDYDDKTTYEIQNRSDKRIEATMRFKVCENVRVEIGQAARQPVTGELVFVMDVPPHETKTLVALFTADEDLPWSFDYDLSVRPSDDPEWL